MNAAFADLLRARGHSGEVDDVPIAGRTDAWIVATLASRHGVEPIDELTLAGFRKAYLANLARELTVPSPEQRVLPGVRALLDCLAQRSDICLALLTGNMKEGARIKLEHFDLWRYFAAGAFGGEAHDRTTLMAEAIADATRACGGPFHPAEAVVIGDTPLDVAVATESGARSLAVATGAFDAESLREAGADVVVDDLSDLPRVLDALGLGPTPTIA
jgi:phosphoglycolate phosphatase-like HAD superfamily hydrolase